MPARNRAYVPAFQIPQIRINFLAICLSPKHIDLIPYEGGLLPPPFFSDSRGRLSLHLENKRLCSHILKSVAGSGTQPQVSRCLFASFSALEKEVTHLFFTCVMRFPVRSGRNAYYIFEHAAEIIHVVIAHHSRNFAYRNVAVRKQFRGSLHS